MMFFIVADNKPLGDLKGAQGKSDVREMFSVLNIASQPCAAANSAAASVGTPSKTVTDDDLTVSLSLSRTKILIV